MLPRFKALFFRVAGMGVQFASGLLVARYGEPRQVADFFLASAAVPLLVLVFGLELHTATDRHVAQGGAVRDVGSWLARRQIPWVIAVFVAASLLTWVGAYSAPLALALLVNGALGLLVQELFRMLILTGRNSAANSVLFLRNAVPFAIYAVFGMLYEFHVYVLMGAWAGASSLAAAVALLELRRNEAERPQVPKLPALAASRYIGSYFPTTLAVRLMLSLDVTVLAHFSEHEQAALYGNLNALLLATFTISDVAVLQWRLRDSMRSYSIDVRVNREIALAALASLLAVITGGCVVVLALAVTPDSELLAIVCLMAIVSGVVVLAQGKHLGAYARGERRRLLRSYSLAFAVFAVGLYVAIQSDRVWMLGASKLLSWTLVLVALQSPRKPTDWRGS